MHDQYLLPLNQYSTTAASAGASISAVPGKILDIHFTNTSASVVYLQIHDKASAPTAGNVPMVSIAVAANGSFSKQAILPIVCSTGIAFGVSSTAATYTSVASGFLDLTYA